MNKTAADTIIRTALKEGRAALSENEAKQVLAAYDLPVTRETLAGSREAVEPAAIAIGYPLAMKGCSHEIAHKTEKGLIYTDIRAGAEALAAYDEITRGMGDHHGSVLIQEMVKGRRELVMGLTRDEQFGPCVMFGLGGIFTEILNDVSFGRAPLDRDEAMRMMREIRGHKIIESFRGLKAADTGRLADMLIRLGEIGLSHQRIQEIDINPVIIRGTDPVVVDALIILN